MHCDYADIRSRIEGAPVWFDENAVPRYEPFRPQALADIYAQEAALVLIGCQSCRTRFTVAFSRSHMDHMLDLMAKRETVTLAERIRDDSLHYGDPPNIGCCPAGPTMNCDDIAVLEYWHRPDFAWVRDPSLEMRLDREATP